MSLKPFVQVTKLQSEAISMLNNLIAATKLPEFNFTWPTITSGKKANKQPIVNVARSPILHVELTLFTGIK